MIEDIRKSINSILYSRVTSPLFGTFVISWLVFNWKIFYTTFFIDDDKIPINKIDYIVENFNNTQNLLWYPLISTLVLLTIIPFISNGAYYLDLWFTQWRIGKKHKLEKKQLLTIEQSIKLREQILETEKRFEELLKNKNDEINQLKEINLLHSNESENDVQAENDKKESQLIGNLFQTIKNNEQLKNGFQIVNDYIVRDYDGIGKDENIQSNVLRYFLTNDVIESLNNGKYKYTRRGKEISKIFDSYEFD